MALLVARVTGSRGLQKGQDASLIMLFPPSPRGPFPRGKAFVLQREGARWVKVELSVFSQGLK